MSGFKINGSVIYLQDYLAGLIKLKNQEVMSLLYKE